MTIRAHVRRLFTSAAIRHGALLESSNGDSSYVHFGALESRGDIFQSGLAVATEFRAALEAFRKQQGINLNCGIALHFMPATWHFSEREALQLAI